MGAEDRQAKLTVGPTNAATKKRTITLTMSLYDAQIEQMKQALSMKEEYIDDATDHARATMQVMGYEYYVGVV